MGNWGEKTLLMGYQFQDIEFRFTSSRVPPRCDNPKISTKPGYGLYIKTRGDKKRNISIYTYNYIYCIYIYTSTNSPLKTPTKTLENMAYYYLKNEGCRFPWSHLHLSWFPWPCGKRLNDPSCPPLSSALPHKSSIISDSRIGWPMARIFLEFCHRNIYIYIVCWNKNFFHAQPKKGGKTNDWNLSKYVGFWFCWSSSNLCILLLQKVNFNIDPCSYQMIQGIRISWCFLKWWSSPRPSNFYVFYFCKGSSGSKAVKPFHVQRFHHPSPMY